ncbi:MAG: HPr family phosphocarrier protein [Candidatus Auribacterota bacterium]|jgi:phosphocarrier protein|nr:HPr family phosphocarrier protein [Candidatus Auribacterota bacterium]
MLEKEVTVLNLKGIHARPSALLVKVANSVKSSVELIKNGQIANAKSVMSIMTLGMLYQDKVTIKTNGPDEQEAMEAVSKVFTLIFHDD